MYYKRITDPKEMVCNLYRQVVKQADKSGIQCSFEIRVSKSMADRLGNTSTINCDGVDVAVIIDDIIIDRQNDDGSISSDIYIIDPEYLENDDGI